MGDIDALAKAVHVMNEALQHDMVNTAQLAAQISKAAMHLGR